MGAIFVQNLSNSVFFSDFCRSKLFLVSGFWPLAVLPNKPIASRQ